MIIRRSPTTLYLITQPAHAALSARIMSDWVPAHFPETPRKPSILYAIEQHDRGWAEFDENLVLDESTGQLLDFTEVPDWIKRDSSDRGIPPLASDPYAAALAAQHRLHIYRRHAGHPEWQHFLAEMTSMRDSYLRESGASLDELLRDYRFVRAADLASLAFCNQWTDTPDDGCGYSLHLDEDTLTITPNPLGGRIIDIAVEARAIGNRLYDSPEDARRAVREAPVETLTGTVRGRS